MEQQINEMKINGVEYVRKDSIQQAQAAPKLDGLEYCIIRTYSAGVFAGYIKSRDKQEATVLQARRLWYWDGANSLSQLAMEGVSKPENCKFPVEVTKIELTNVVEVISCTEEAKESIANVAIWSDQK